VGTNCDTEIFERARRLMIPLLERRVRVRLLGVTLSNLRPADSQFDLFTPGLQMRDMRFYRTVDNLREKYGFGSVRKGRALWLDNFRRPPESARRRAG
jgi:hypothetical protein